MVFVNNQINGLNVIGHERFLKTKVASEDYGDFLVVWD